ncbi:hypothetical protein ZWY2020_045720 [Hordeum vulgare]|nr:hypothetical protein ZWY2020_045720 [Hordeum vulgare]
MHRRHLVMNPFNQACVCCCHKANLSISASSGELLVWRGAMTTMLRRHVGAARACYELPAVMMLLRWRLGLSGVAVTAPPCREPMKAQLRDGCYDGGSDSSNEVATATPYCQLVLRWWFRMLWQCCDNDVVM